MEPGEYAMRGGIIDIFPAGEADPVRLDLFGDTIELIRIFDPGTQRSADRRQRLTLRPVSEVPLDPRRDRALPLRLARAVRPAGGGRPDLPVDLATVGGIPAWSTGCRCSTSGWRRCSTICRAPRSAWTIRPTRCWQRGWR